VFTCVANKVAAVTEGGDSTRLKRLFTNPQTIQRGSVTRFIDSPQIIKQAAAAADQLQEATSGMMIFLMELEMVSEIADSVREYSYLHFRRAGILVMLPILPNQVVLGFL
jgi:hypothetical protein